MLQALLAELYCSLERVYSNIELIYVCPQHPCDDPYVPSDDFRPSGAFEASQAYERSETDDGEESGEPAPCRRATRRRQSRECDIRSADGSTVERRAGTAGVSVVRYRWSPNRYTKTTKNNTKNK